ncbi:efflux RND transporter periplasmic adaptor subunit [Vibrio sp. HN007]|uniref:efflux RND transporter periplasmic adaptor subunit n=1 Tax=Vibrio iocasae TaxID=3098914 RepID=UPI0035D42053
MKKTNMKKLSASLLAIMMIPAAVMYTDYAISNQPESVTAKNEIVLPGVTVQRLSSGTHNSIIEGYGEVVSSETLSLLGHVSGRVIWRAEEFKVGKLVKKGTLLLRIEDSDYQAALANAKKTLADAHLALLQEQRKHQRAQDNWKRSEISEKPSKLALREPQLEIARSQYVAAKKAVKNAETNLANTRVYAPFDSVITSRSVTNGSYVSPGATIGELKASETAEVKIALSESEWQQLPADLGSLQVELSSPNNRGFYWNGYVSDLALVIDQSTRTRTLTIKIDSPLSQDIPLLFGSFVVVHLQGKAIPDSYVISSSSITADGFIWFEKENQLFKHKAVALFRDADEVGIARGNLDKEISLVKKPLSHYIDGMKVTATEDRTDG